MTTPIYKDLEVRWAVPDHAVGKDLTLEWDEADTLPDNQSRILNDGFLTDVDLAMKTKLKGLIVNDEETPATGRRARVFFRWPDYTITDATFPFITIDLLRFERASQREQRAGYRNIPYIPKNFAADAEYDSNATAGTPESFPMYFQRPAEMPIPFDLTYQLTVHSRRSRHDRQLSMQMLQDDRFPVRGAWLIVGDTVRQMFVSGPTNADGLDPAPGGRPKRHFRKVWTATVSAEFFQKDIEMLGKVSTLVTDVRISTTIG